MTTHNNVAPIIIKRKKIIVSGGHHGGAWKVAYLDTVAAQTSAFETVLNDQRMFLNHASDSLDFLQHSGRQFGEDMLALNQSATHIVDIRI